MRFETNKQTVLISVGAGSLLLSMIEPYGEIITGDTKPALDSQVGPTCP